MSTANSVVKALKKFGTPERAKASAWFFKTEKGQYGYGDVFIGVTVPEQRKVAERFAELPLLEIQKLLNNKIHECRLTALIILVNQYKNADPTAQAGKKHQDAITRFYLLNSKKINNWDLVDSSASYILGQNLLNKNNAVLYKLAKSKNLWERRIAIISTFANIRAGRYADTLKISEILLDDSHDLIHKAAGWALREVGKKSLATEEQFLKKHKARMPRTMLRYAIEKFPEAKRKGYLKK